MTINPTFIAVMFTLAMCVIALFFATRHTRHRDKKPPPSDRA